MNTDKRGFTLIELLVAVLIIGILAAIALPQYRAAIIRSRTAEPLSIIKTIMAANEVYRLVHGDYPLTFEGLDIELPSDSNVCGSNQNCRATKNYKYQQHGKGTVSSALKENPTFEITYYGKSCNYPLLCGHLICGARIDDKDALKVCQTLAKDASSFLLSGTYNHYPID